MLQCGTPPLFGSSNLENRTLQLLGTGAADVSNTNHSHKQKANTDGTN